MKQIVGVRFSEYGQIAVCEYNPPEGAPMLAPNNGVIAQMEYGQIFGRLIWQHIVDSNFTAESYLRDFGNAATSLGDTFEGGMDAMLYEDADFHKISEFTELYENNDPLNEAGAHAQPVFTKAPQHTEKAKLPFVRPATEEELVKAVANETLCREARVFCRKCIAQRVLDMKLVDVEILHDRTKMVFYFTAPTRIDFRELVKDLVRQYRTRIELRQIGVRHETQMLGALGNCGMACCCRRYLRKFAPVTIKMAKEQNLFLNPAKISGICGRLLCCLSFEQENYDSFHRSCPKLGKRYQTNQGPQRVLRGNMFRNSIIVLPDSGQETEYTLEEWAALQPRRTDATGSLARETRALHEIANTTAGADIQDGNLGPFEEPEAAEECMVEGLGRGNLLGEDDSKIKNKRRRRRHNNACPNPTNGKS